MKDINRIPLEEFCHMLPKVELHAHINGSISKETMTKLIKMKCAKNELEDTVTQEMTLILDGQQKTLDECFAIFKVVVKIVDNPEAVYIATTDIIKDFANDGVKYLELRSTPKCNDKMTKENYIDAVLKAIDECNNDKDLGIIAKFLVSIDRRNGGLVAEQTIDLAREYQLKNDSVIGIDLSGDPAKGKSADFIPALAQAKSFGLKNAVHLAETKDEHSEISAFFNVMPDRIGHGTCLLPEDGGSQEFVDIITKHQTPLELCLTSNVKGQTVMNYDVHHFKKWYDMGHPCIICTDDKGVFDTNLSKEYSLAAGAFELDNEALWNLSESAINSTFAPEGIKRDLKNQWKSMKKRILVE